MKFNKQLLLVVCRDLFLVLYILFIVFSFMELLKPKIVLNYINLDLYLFLLLIFGVITIIYFPLTKKDNKFLFRDYLTVILISLLLGLLVVYLTKAIGFLSILIGIVSAIISYLFIILVSKGR